MMHAVYLVALLAMALEAAPTGAGFNRTAVSTWSCTTHNHSVVVPGTTGDDAPAVEWWRGTCTGRTVLGPVGPITVNILNATLTRPDVYFRPLVAQTTAKVDNLAAIMAQDKNAVGGVNGGYFFRVDVKRFLDDVCFGKTKAEAEKPVNMSCPNCGVGDGAIVSDGKLLATNCNPLYGYNRPTTLAFNGTDSFIDVQHTADPPPPGVKDCLAAGPNLVSFNATAGTAYVDIPAGDQNFNIFGHSANTAVGLMGNPAGGPPSTPRGGRPKAQRVVMVTFNGRDGCSVYDPTCGIDAYLLAFFMKDYVRSVSAMNMDQGGSTTMVVKGKGMVSCSSEPNCSGNGRELYSGLFVGVRKSTWSP